MEKITNINTIDLQNANCLIEIVGMFNQETTSGILVGDVAYNRGDHAIRYGILKRLPANINWKQARWKFVDYPDEGDEVWFDYLDAKDKTIVEHEGKKHIILPIYSLILARSPKKGINPLNGYMLAQKHPKKPSEIITHAQQYWDDIYDIKYAGKPNEWYKHDMDMYGNAIDDKMDDPSITANQTVITKGIAYPILEDSLHARFSEETYYYFQRKEVMAKVEEL